MRCFDPRLAGLIAFVLLSACGGGSGSSAGSSGGTSGPPQQPPPTQPPPPTPPPTQSINFMDPKMWQIGPIIGSQNYSVGMPLNPSPHPNGWVIELPQPDSSVGHVHYVTYPYNRSLAGKSRIVVKYRIEAAPDVKIYPTKFPGWQAMFTLYFQRKGDNWSAAGPYEAYRWWASYKSHLPLSAGQFEMTASFNENWTAVETSSAVNNPTGFQGALANVERIGFTLGGGDGLGHGIYATGPARLIITDFRVE